MKNYEIEKYENLFTRISLRISVGLPPSPTKDEIGIDKFDGSLSKFIKHKTNSMKIIERMKEYGEI